jgi:hypothetical protein
MECEKCSYESKDNKKIIINNREIYLCSICRKFLPSNPPDIETYLKEKLNWQILETFRKFLKAGKGMEEKAKQGKIMSRAAFGYKIINKELLPDEEKSLIVQKIFMDFLSQDISLNQLAKNYKFSVNGIKKILKNFTYIGKIKFDGQILPGSHKPIISPDLFNKVQSKLESLGM